MDKINNFNKDNNSKLVLIDGVWGIGKTPICNDLSEKFNFLFIEEPNHFEDQINKDFGDLHCWYYSRHLENLFKGLYKAEEGFNVVVERSPLFSLLFKEVIQNREVSDKEYKILHSILSLYKNIYFVYLPPFSIEKSLDKGMSFKHLEEILNLNNVAKLDKKIKQYIIDLNKRGLVKSVIFSDEDRSKSIISKRIYDIVLSSKNQ